MGRNSHLRSHTIGGEEITRPVYELQLLEGPQIKAKNQLLDQEYEQSKPYPLKNTMGLGIFRESKQNNGSFIPFSNNYQKSKMARDREQSSNNIKKLTSNAE